jgi:hypothetical protein
VSTGKDIGLIPLRERVEGRAAILLQIVSGESVAICEGKKITNCKKSRRTGERIIARDHCEAHTHGPLRENEKNL